MKPSFRVKFLVSALTALCGHGAAVAENILEVYRQALTSNPQILQDKAERDQVHAQTGVAMSVLLPQISGSFGYEYTDYIKM